MASSIIRGKYLITRALDRQRYEQIDNGAVLQHDGIIAAIGDVATLRRQHSDLEVIGTGEHVKAFYEGYWDAAAHEPFYRQRSRQ